MADQDTITRIGGLLKTVYGDAIIEQQNKAAVIRKKFTKAKGTRMGGDHLELSVRMGGNRAGVGARMSDGPLPVPGLQQQKKALIYDRAMFGVIKVYDKDIENSKTNQQAFANHLDNEVTEVVKDVTKCQNIITYGDGTGTLGLVNANTAASTTFVAKTGTAFGDFGTRYLQVGDQIDIWDPTFATLRNTAGGVSITAINTSNQTVTLSAAQTLTAGDVVVRSGAANLEYVGLWMMTDNAPGVTFEGLSRATYPQWRGNVIDCGGNPLTEANLQQLMSQIETSSGSEVNQIVAGFNVRDQYVSLGQSLKRYSDMKLDRGFKMLSYNGVDFTVDVDTPPAALFMFADDHVQNGVVTPLSWDEKGGGVLKWNAGFAAFTGYCREYGNYVCDRPNATGRLQTLQVSAADVR